METIAPPQCLSHRLKQLHKATNQRPVQQQESLQSKLATQFSIGAEPHRFKSLAPVLCDPPSNRSY